MRTLRHAARTALTVDECKVRASVLLKDLRSDDRPRAIRAAERFRILPFLAALDPETILAQRETIRLKHALTTLAAELGYPARTDCKRRLEVPATARLDTERFFSVASCGLLNRWFARYDEARASLESHGGYLFPYRHQFFICEWGFLTAHEIDPHDPDWERIGYDWVRPRDEAAHGRLERMLVARGYGGRPTD